MKVYHVSETLKLNEELKTDYKEPANLAEPFVKAMKHSFEMFYGMLLQADYMEAEQFHLYELELEGNYLECDMNLFDEAFDQIWELDSPMQMMNAMNLARKYFRGDRGENAVMEIISEEKAVAVKDVTALLR